MADYIGATPQENPLMGLLAERLKQAQQFAAKPFGYQNPPAEMLMNLLGIPAVQQTAERIAYGEPMTTGRGMTTQVRPEVIEAAMTVAPAAGLLGRGVERGAMAAGRAGERYAEKVVPQIMERGGLPAQLLGDLSQGSMSRAVPEVGLLKQEAKAALPNDYYELNGMATQAYADYRANPSQETGEFYKSIMKARDEAPNNPSNNYTPPTHDVIPEDYRGQHAAPMKDSGAPLWKLEGIYHEDFYSYKGAQYYGDGAEPARDAMIVSQMQAMKNRPDKQVTIYRAVPKSVSTKEALNTGDWVTLDRKYAKEHGEGALNGDYKIVKKTVKARDLFTNGDSIYEMGYDPQPFMSKRDLGLLD